MKSTALTAVVLTHNSARTLSAVLKALTWCEEILVIDSGSTDRSLEIARGLGARVVEHKFSGFGDQKHFAVTQASHDWVFVVDSDEVVSNELRDEIRECFEKGHGDIVGYHTALKLVFLGSPMSYSGNTIKHSLRLFNRQYGNFNFALVHESVELVGNQSYLKHMMWHYSYLTLEDYFQKFNRYTTYGAQELYRLGKRPHALKVWLSFPTCFFKMYFLKLGILDGYQGFLWCLLSSLYPVIKYAKLKEMSKQEALPLAVEKTVEAK